MWFPITEMRAVPRRGQIATARIVRLLVLTLLTGCGGGEPAPRLVRVTGKVLKDGKPLTAGSIIFHPAAANSYTKDNPSSLLQLDGSFTMKTFPFGEGVSPGKYKVTLAPELASRISKLEYGRADKTPWEVEVPEAGLTDQVLEVK
jgi:hypothetical protein